jgi:hypothetical protein
MESIKLDQHTWNPGTRIAFRFAFAYFAFYELSFVQRLMESWVAVHVFHLNDAVTMRHFTGSGDTTLDYIDLLLTVTMAAITSAVWTIIDRKRPDYRTLHRWLRLFVRYVLGSILMYYGFAKIIPIQMPVPGVARLIEPLGNFSPMGLLWAFLGASPTYQAFAGASEIVAGALLLFSRTATLGGLVSATVLFNVVMLNFCFDVPVKLFSSNLLVMALFIAIPDIGRLADVLILRRSARPYVDYGLVLRSRPEKIGAATIKAIVIGVILLIPLMTTYGSYRAGVLKPMIDTSPYLLLNRGFHWIQESPFNR